MLINSYFYFQSFMLVAKLTILNILLMNNPENKIQGLDFSNVFTSVSIRKQQSNSKGLNRLTEPITQNYSLSLQFTKFIPKYPFKRAASSFSQRKNPDKSKSKPHFEDIYRSQRNFNGGNKKKGKSSYIKTRKQDSKQLYGATKPQPLQKKFSGLKPGEFQSSLSKQLYQEKRMDLNLKGRSKNERIKLRGLSLNKIIEVDFKSMVHGQKYFKDEKLSTDFS